VNYRYQAAEIFWRNFFRAIAHPEIVRAPGVADFHDEPI